jgi:predicted enzyme related to lactoylglutathione lyase
MIQGVQLIVYPVRDLAKATAAFSQWLGVKPYADTPYYVGFQVGQQEIGLDPNGHKQGQTGPLAYWYVDDIAGSLQTFEAGGAQVLQAAQDVGGGKLIAKVKDADGNLIGLVQMP